MLSSTTFGAMGVVNTVAVEEPRALQEALAIVEAQVRAIDRVCSRFRPDSELSAANRAAGSGFFDLHPLLEEALGAALRAAAMTGGLVDPTVGRRVEDVGYNVTYSAVAKDGPPLELHVRTVPGWRSVELDTTRHTLRMPAGVSLDLGASGKAWAADRAAATAAKTLGVPVLVECGGDVALGGGAPANGWPVRVALDETAPEGQDVLLREGGLATSGTTSRRWRRGGQVVHDIIDPRTRMPACTPWEMVTVAAATCLEANAGATAALILGDDAPSWLAACGLPARLVREDGTVRRLGGWAA